MAFNHRSPPVGTSALVAAAALAISPAAWPLGLGDVKVESYLNQPLRARIELITQESDDVGSVIARLASARDYELIGASRESVPVPISFSIEDPDGDAYILATSNLPVGEPIVRLIVEVTWSSGRMLREYTLFLDPPTVSEAAPAPRVDQRRSAAPAPAAEAPAAAAAPAEAPTQDSAREPASEPAVPAGGGDYGPVRGGETLWGIASNWSRGSGLDMNRVMIAIQQQNPDAFLNGNINLLKRGAILRMPELSEVEALSVAAANREVAAQEEAFAGRRAVDTVVSPATPLLADEAAPAPIEREAEPAPLAQTEPEEPAETGEDAAEAVPAEPAATAPEAAESRDVLELVPPSPESDPAGAFGFEESGQGAAATEEVDALRENLSRTEEELVNQQQQNAYLEERIRELEGQLEGAQDDGVEAADMANMEARLEEQRQAEAQARAQAEQAAAGSWYTRLWVWLIGLLALAAIVAGWLFSRRRDSGLEGAAASTGDSLRDIKSEAEDVLRVLSDEDRPRTPESARAASPDEVETVVVAATPAASEPAEETKAPARFGGSVDDAELLDEESSDPEIQLDLARAYISMGDREAARVILDEVVNNGTEAQQAEARKMLAIL